MNLARSHLLSRAREGFLEHIVWVGSDFYVSVRDKRFVVTPGTIGSILRVGKQGRPAFGLQWTDVDDGDMLVLFEGALLATIGIESAWSPLSFPTSKRIQQAFGRAFELFLQRESALLRGDVNERTLTGRLALHLQKYFAEWHVDCEYNRSLRPDGETAPKELAFWTIEEPHALNWQGLRRSQVYPDIIVHRRESSCNLLVLEMKKLESSGVTFKIGRAGDLTKLRSFREQLGYRYGVFVAVETGEEAGLSEIYWDSDDLPTIPGGPLCAVKFPQGDRQLFSAGSGPSRLVRGESNEAE